MPFESLVEDEISMMEDQLNESGRALETHEIQVPLGSIMHHVPSVLSGASVQDAINLMVSRDVGSIFVVSDERLKGIIGERDILLKVLNKQVDYANLTVDHFMKSDPLSLKPEDLLDTAIQHMAQGRFRHIPIVDDEYRPLGMVSVRHIISDLVEHFPQEVLTLPPKPIRNAMRAREGA